MSVTPPSAQIEPLKGDSFQFDCHPGVSCFGRCCSDLTLALQPYDALRLRRRLRMGSQEFLDRHTETVRSPETGAPRVQLRMGEDDDRSCPFLAEGGCSVYEDRPGACRIFPLGRAASLGAPVGRAAPGSSPKGANERFFLVREEVCAGFQETRRWEVADWLSDQGLEPYLRHSDAWLPVFTRLPRLAGTPHAEQRYSVFYTAGYNHDRFRVLVAGEAFTSRFAISEETSRFLQDDDEALLDFAIRWLRFALFGERTLAL